jgi:eukaryotic-like serine/threonine-protein kinase
MTLASRLTMQMTSCGLQESDVLDGKYVVRNCIGQGGMGSVFLADQPSLRRQVAIKMLRPERTRSASQAQRMRAEAVAACHVHNPHCVSVIDCCNLPDGTPYIVMQYIPGLPLGCLIGEDRLSLVRALELFAQILSAIGAVHDSGIIHADVKSDNFLVESFEERDHVTLIDFGLAQFAGEHSRLRAENGERVISGTPDYMAPEVIRGEPPTHASDLYAAGVILYELLTGTLPFSGETAKEIITHHLCDDVVPPSQRRPARRISPALDGIVLRALAKEPAQRFPDAATFARELRAVSVDLASSAEGPAESSATSAVESPAESWLCLDDSWDDASLTQRRSAPVFHGQSSEDPESIRPTPHEDLVQPSASRAPRSSRRTTLTYSHV